jgi:hypothetical protein
MDSTRHRVYGVDFSGAKDAGRKIWVAEGVVHGEALRINACHRGDELPGSGKGRDACLAALTDFIRDRGESVFGLDFPFGLPESLVREEDWEPFILAFPDRFRSPDAFREACRGAADGKELKRTTDRDARTPFSPYNIRLYRQTYYGIRDLLHPLVRDGAAAVLPMQEPLPGRAWLLEICPASTLRRRALYQRSYKGGESEKRAARVEIIETLEGEGELVISGRGVRYDLIENPGGDALDSAIAALAVAKAIRDPAFPGHDPGDPYSVEGYVYV